MKTYDVRNNKNAPLIQGEYSTWYLGTWDGKTLCLMENDGSNEHEFGLATVGKVIAEGFFCGTYNDWQKVINQNLRDEYGLDML